MLDFLLTVERVETFLAGFATFFLMASVRFTAAFFEAPLLETVDLEDFRVRVFETAALFAFGRTAFAFTARLLTDDFAGDRRTGVRDVERRNPFVMGLLI